MLVKARRKTHQGLMYTMSYLQRYRTMWHFGRCFHTPCVCVYTNPYPTTPFLLPSPPFHKHLLEGEMVSLRVRGALDESIQWVSLVMIVSSDSISIHGILMRETRFNTIVYVCVCMKGCGGLYFWSVVYICGNSTTHGENKKEKPSIDKWLHFMMCVCRNRK